MVSKSRMDVVKKEIVGMIGSKARVAVEISWISKWPAVRFAVSRTPRARGRIRRLVVSIKISAGIRGVGVPSGRRWPRDIEGWFRSPVSRVASHSGNARAMFIDNWVVGVNVYGNRPNRLIISSRDTKDVRMIDHL